MPSFIASLSLLPQGEQRTQRLKHALAHQMEAVIIGVDEILQAVILPALWEKGFSIQEGRQAVA